MNEDSRDLLVFLCFLGHQRAAFRGDRFFELRSALAQGLFPPLVDFFALFPEFDTWKEKSPHWWKKACDEIRRERERGRHFLLRGEADFPARLECIPDPPSVLTVLGNVAALSRPGFAVVGAREPTRSSLQWMDEHLSEALREHPAIVISGGARGVDQAAHRVALRQGKATILFLPSGLRELYPKDLKEWVLPVCEAGGAFVSEFHPRTPMRKWNFPVRNRLIAGLGLVCLVIEARMRSGTHLTARLARDAGREVGCLPAAPWDVSSGGNLELLAQGAQIIKDAQDLVMFLSREVESAGRQPLRLGGEKESFH